MTEELNTLDTQIAPEAATTPSSDTALPVADATGEPVISEDDALGAIFDRLTAEGVDVEDGPKEQQRGPDGKFVSPNAERDAAKGEGAGENAVSSTVTAAAPAPAHLPQAIKADWDKIPETARNAIVSHQTDMDRRFGEQGRQLETLKPLNEGLQQVIQQWPEYFQNATPAQIAKGAADLAVIQSRLEKGDLNSKLQTYIEIGKTYGLLGPVSQILAGQQLPDNANDANALRNEIAQLKQQLAQIGDPNAIEEKINQAFSQRQQAEADNRFVEQLAAGKQFFAEVQEDLPFYITKARSQLGEAATAQAVFDQAYDMAINADPILRAKAAAPGKTAANVDPKRKEAAEKATAINVTSSSHGKDRALSEDDALARAYDRATAA